MELDDYIWVKEKHHKCSWNYKYGADRVLSLESEHFYPNIKTMKIQLEIL